MKGKLSGPPESVSPLLQPTAEENELRSTHTTLRPDGSVTRQAGVDLPKRKAHLPLASAHECGLRMPLSQSTHPRGHTMDRGRLWRMDRDRDATSLAGNRLLAALA